MINVLVVDHPQAVRRALCSRLALEPDFVSIDHAGDIRSAVQRAGLQHPDVVLLDAEMPGLDLSEAVRALRRRSPASAIVVLSLDSVDAVRSLGTGAVTLVGKHEGVETLLDAIRRAAARRRAGADPRRGSVPSHRDAGLDPRPPAGPALHLQAAAYPSRPLLHRA